MLRLGGADRCRAAPLGGAEPRRKTMRRSGGGSMKIARVETLRADAGWRLFSFLKVTTDDGLIGWAPNNQSLGSSRPSSVIEGLTPLIIGRDPCRFEEVTAWLHVMTRQSRGGLNQQAI